MRASLRKPTRAAAVFLAASALGLVFALQLSIALWDRGEALELRRILLMQLPPWYIWALLTPLVARTARRYRILQPGWGRAAVVHLALALALMGVRAGIETVMYLSINTAFSIPVDPWPTAFRRWFTFRIGTDLLAYGLILGITSAMDYQRRLRQEEHTASRLAAQLADARLLALRMQLNPHFLFNALNSVAMLVRQRAHQEAVNLVASLADLLRYVLADGHAGEVPLRQEVAFLERYLEIERVRFGDRLRLEVEVAPEAGDAFVPNLLLQPLVENAVRHGIAPRAGAGLIRLSASVEGSRLVLRVEDDGRGPSADDESGVGLRNVQERLRTHYGDAYGVRLLPRPEGGAVALVELPLRTGSASTWKSASAPSL